MFEVGDRVILVYPEGDTDMVTILHLYAQVAFVELPDGTRTMSLLEDLISLKESN